MKHSLLLVPLFCLAATTFATNTATITAPVAMSTLARPVRSLQRFDSEWVRKANTILAPERLKGRVLEEVAGELAACGPNAIQAYFAILAGTVDGPIREGARRPPADALDPDAVLFAALARMDPRLVAAHVAVATGADASVDVRVVALRVLSNTASPAALDAWLEVATQISELQMTPPYVKGPCASALAKILARDASLFPRLSRALPTLPPHLLPAVLEGVAASRRRSGLPLMTERLGRDDEQDLLLLPGIAALVETTSGDLTEDELTWLRPFATDIDWRVRREAILALGRVQDWRSHGEIEAQLGDEQRLVQQSAHWALTHMSKLDFGYDAAAWATWFESEMRWYETNGSHLTRVIQTGTPATVLEAVRELSGHALFRHEVARTVAALCASDNANLVKQLCLVLRQLDSPAACPALVDALASSDGSIRAALRDTLAAITHLQLAPEQAEWRRALVGT